MPGLQVSGVGSGLDIEGLVTKLMDVEKQPITKMQSTIKTYQSQISDLGKMQASFSKLQAAIQSLSTASTSTSALTYKALSSDATIFGASVSGTPSAGQYAINVSTLSAGQKILSNTSTASPSTQYTTNTATLSIQLGTISGGALDPDTGVYTGSTFTNSAATSVNISIDAGSSLNQIRDKINVANAGVRASVIYDGAAYRLSISSTGTGTDTSMKITSTGDAALSTLVSYDPQGTQNFRQTQPASNLSAVIDGVQVSSKTNSIANAIEGISITVSKTGSATLSVGQDTSAATQAVQNLVSSWNEALATYNSLAGYNASTKKAGSLLGDSFIRSTFNELRNSIFGASAGSGAPDVSVKTLGALGIKLDSKGVASLDTAKFSTNIGNDPTLLTKLFASDKGNLFSGATSAIENVLGTNGLSTRITGLNRRIDSVNGQIERISDRLITTERTLRNKFTNLDTMVASLNSTSSFLTQKFSNSN